MAKEARNEPDGRNKKSGHCPLFRIRTGRTPGSGAASSSVVSACSGTQSKGIIPSHPAATQRLLMPVCL
ncbi:hypothetical protein AJ87_01790 [Rhizobium yanglingense]|nr:hypothetical protein AJ87_01790 [Rhizobium yanglingense]